MKALHDVRVVAGSFNQQSSPDTTTVRTFTPPNGARACLITVETTAARVSFHGTDPSATVGNVIPKDALPFYLPAAVVVKAVSTAAAASIVNVTWLF